MKGKNLLKYAYVLPTVCFFLLVFSLCLTNFGTVWNFTKTVLSYSYVDYTNGMEAQLSDNLKQKYDYIELNGAMNRLLGLNTLNERQKLANGYLATFTQFKEQQPQIDAIKALSDFLAEDGIGFLCATMPVKEYSYAAQFAPGYETDGNAQYKAFFAPLTSLDVPFLDLETRFEAQGWPLEDIYFKTDHHWLPQAALEATRAVMEFYAEHNGVAYDPQTLDAENWNVELYPEWFIGSEGRRTGATYAGIDPLPYVYPKYEMDVYAGRIVESGYQEMALENTVYSPSYLEEPAGYTRSAYCLYLGGDYPYAYLRNETSANDQTILVVGDSYRLPMECFLSTQFRELYHVDMRHYQDGTFAQLVKQLEPDLVLLMFCAPGNEECRVFGLEQWQEDFAGRQPGDILLQQQELVLPETTAGSKNHILAANLASGSYVLTIDSAQLARTLPTDSPGPGIFVQCALVNLENRIIHARRYFNTGTEDPQKWLFTVPENEAGSYAVVVYHGSENYTAGNTATLRGLTLRQYQ